MKRPRSGAPKRDNPRKKNTRGRPGPPQPARDARHHAGPRGRPAPNAAPKPAQKQQESRIDPRKLEQALAKPAAPLRVGEWLWTMREGAERDLIEELLSLPGDLRPRLLAPALVASARGPALREGRLDLTFARQGFQVTQLAEHADPDQLASQLSAKLRETQQSTERHALQVFVPDSAKGNELSAHAQRVRDKIEHQLAQGAAEQGQEPAAETQLRRHGGMISQVCIYSPEHAAVGCIASEQALSIWPGGRARMRLGGDFPSRAARKLAEAFAWLGLAPGAGERCVDLGAAPGGWSWLLLEKRARVIAVDPARMDVQLMRNPRLRHVQGNAFDYQPEEPVDWLFCDMAYRPLEVAQMLGRWARRKDTRLLVANFKLPMKRKVEMVERIRSLLSESGFMSIRTRQLYHDREEITLTAHVH